MNQKQYQNVTAAATATIAMLTKRTQESIINKFQYEQQQKCFCTSDIKQQTSYHVVSMHYHLIARYEFFRDQEELCQELQLSYKW